MFADDIWVIVYVCGPEDEINRMKKLCKLPDIQHVTDDPVVDFTNLANGTVGGEYFTWNYAELGPHEEGSHTFQFDTSGKVPRDIFEALAREFPTLEFEVDCQGSLGEFAICGRYNHPNLPDEFWDDKDNELRQSIELY